MPDQLTDDDMGVVLESLKYYKDRIENYQGYPSYEFKQQQMRRVESVIAKMRLVGDELAGSDPKKK
jgi:hypothetical protein